MSCEHQKTCNLKYVLDNGKERPVKQNEDCQLADVKQFCAIYKEFLTFSEKNETRNQKSS